MQADDVARLALAQALYKKVANLVSTRDPESLRWQFDREILANYAESGAKSGEMRIGGEKVGTWSVVKGEPSSTRHWKVRDEDAVLDRLDADDLRYFAKEHMDYLIEWMEDNGLEVPGLYHEDVRDPEKPPRVAIRLNDPDEVIETARRTLPPDHMRALLGGDTE